MLEPIVFIEACYRYAISAFVTEEFYFSTSNPLKFTPAIYRIARKF